MLSLLGRIFVWAAGLLALLAALGFATLYLQGQQHSSNSPAYVALGSSFASGPGVPERIKDSPFPCMRSDHDYPHQLAARRNLSLADVTCSGATTHDILDHSQFFTRPQIQAVSAETELVTITIGG